MANTTITPAAGAIAFAGVASALALAITPTVSWERQGESATLTWPAIPAGYLGGAPARIGYYQASFQASGVWGSAGSIKLQGSNDGLNWNDLSPAALTGAGFFASLGATERPKFIRP